jgi:ornithine carbamoyltransferase
MRTRIAQLLAVTVLLGVPISCALAQQDHPGQLLSGCANYKNWRSAVSTQAVNLRFVNKGKAPIRVLWIDFNGHEVLYTALEGGQMWGVRSFMTHPWLITSADGNKCLAAFVAGASQTITIDEDQHATARSDDVHSI